MRRILLLGVLLVAMLVTVGGAAASSEREFEARLSGAQEVPSVDTKAHGKATFELSEDGSRLEYKLVVNDIDNVVAAHIHLGPAGVNGPVVAFLYGPVAPGGGRIGGNIATGTITSANLVGPLAGHPLADLIAAMEAGGTYANVHTNDGVDPTNTGPGDFPGGEIRGQIFPD